MKQEKDQDFSKFAGKLKASRKELLLRKCQKRNVGIYIDDASEVSAEPYASMRAVASEAELERRLSANQAARAARGARRAAPISWRAFLCSYHL